jgi:diaminopimelate epimerase
MNSPTATLPFEKWQGIGNDFVIVRREDLIATGHRSEGEITALAKRLCDRHFGIGADGLLVVDTAGIEPRMTVYNADGSQPEMCGNGLRCVVGFLAAGAATATGTSGAVSTGSVSTGAGRKAWTLEGKLISIDMGVVQSKGEHTFAASTGSLSFLAVDVGNPHLVAFGDFRREDLDSSGPALTSTPPHGANIELCTLREDEHGAFVDVLVWERGVGPTLACGTGACAVAFAAIVRRVHHDYRWGSPIRVRLPGGELTITIEEQSQRATLSGTAERVFVGSIAIESP